MTALLLGRLKAVPFDGRVDASLPTTELCQRDRTANVGIGHPSPPKNSSWQAIPQSKALQEHHGPSSWSLLRLQPGPQHTVQRPLSPATQICFFVASDVVSRQNFSSPQYVPQPLTSAGSKRTRFQDQLPEDHTSNRCVVYRFEAQIREVLMNGFDREWGSGGKREMLYAAQPDSVLGYGICPCLLFGDGLTRQANTVFFFRSSRLVFVFRRHWGCRDPGHLSIQALILCGGNGNVWLYVDLELRDEGDVVSGLLDFTTMRSIHGRVETVGVGQFWRVVEPLEPEKPTMAAAMEYLDSMATQRYDHVHGVR
ncbi:uncharacterized protein BKA55DRAFT_697558 [Fusarium redolens]|uniref:Uncharacterized protein n=1 Tax=Fusarium redolens TaxID=48865 RepID=A0A9P9FWV5_FUSRE|nr:uncharacterized protein BKA55DRAFT_697558 [Fusarium redolens]KAH7220504.1 hypothetical protein BKA55DRAFT_697558 [Fusarium redolens]